MFKISGVDVGSGTLLECSPAADECGFMFNMTEFEILLHSFGCAQTFMGVPLIIVCLLNTC